MSSGNPVPEGGVAVISMSGRFPGARDVDQLWSNLCNGVESIRSLARDELLAEGLPASLIDDPGYVPAAGLLDGVEGFDAGFFGFSPREAELLDPQQRLFLECAVEVLERAGYGAPGCPGRVGVYAGAGMSGYLLHNIVSRADLIDQVGPFQALVANDKDFLATRVSYKLNLRGPSISVQTACSTSLVAVALACQALLDGECDMALAGGVTVRVPHRTGYLYQKEGILSPDGHCRAFDAAAAGTVPGSGVGVVLLKPLARAFEDGDWIHAVVRGWALNNDGAAKVGYTAPSVEGQAAVISEALAIAGIDPATIGYVEAHGTGTRLGDPIEVAALTRVFGDAGARPASCALGSLKTNLGHLDCAAGVAGMIKAALAVERGRIPPTLHWSRPNPEIDFAAGPFYVPASLVDWRAGSEPRRAGVSSFGIGGTNAHVVLEEPPPRPAAQHRASWIGLPVSARSAEALDRACEELAAHVDRRPDLDLDDVAFTRQVGRRSFAHRRFVVAGDREMAISGLSAPIAWGSTPVEGEPPPVAFLFPGQGAQHPGMGRHLYRASAVFRRELDACLEILQPLLGDDLRDLLCGERIESAVDADRLEATAMAQPCLFAVEYALARLWLELGVEPSLMLGHSLGEYVAACLAGVFSVEDALAIVAERGRLIQEMPSGAMLAVPLPREEVLDLVGGEISLAAINGPRQCTVSGPHESIARLEREMGKRGLMTRRLRTSHAFHSPIIAPAASAFRSRLAGVELRAPRIPFVSNVTGAPIRDEEARDPGYWARHMLEPVRFHDGVSVLLAEARQVLLEVGPGDTLTALARQAGGVRGRKLIASSPRSSDLQASGRSFLTAAGDLWLAGVPLRWEGLHAGIARRRVPLPTYPFERGRCWVQPGDGGDSERRPGPIFKRPEMTKWFYVPSWRRTAPLAAPIPEEEGSPWLLVGEGGGLAGEIAQGLRRSGRSVYRVPIGAGSAETDGLPIVDLEREGSYDDFLGFLSERAGLPGRILHLLPLDETSGADSFRHLLYLARAVSRCSRGRFVEFTVAGRGLQEVTGGDVADPAPASILGLCRVISQEYPHLGCRVVDLSPGDDGTPGQDVTALLKEAGAGGDDPVVAYRGGHRWLQSFEPLALGTPAAGPRPWSEGAHLLVTGGLGRLGLSIAGHLARTRESIAITLIDVTSPEDGGARAVPLSAELSRLQGFDGARIWAARANVADRERMEAVVAEARRRHGRITGVIHAAGRAGDGAYRTLDETDAALGDAHFQPKIEGLRVLADLVAEDAPEICLAVSSLAPILGGIGLGAFAAADSWMDALVHRIRGRGRAEWRSVHWEGWEEGVAAEAAGLLGRQQSSLMMTLPEVADALELIVAGAPAPSVVVATGELGARIDQWTHVLSGARGPAAPGAPRTAAAAFQAPRSEIETRIAALWAAALGVEAVGVDDDFFELGGNSLIGLQILSRMRSEFQADIPLRSFFEARTVAGMAKAVAADRESGDERLARISTILDEIESLSDQEAEDRLAGISETGERPRVETEQVGGST